MSTLNPGGRLAVGQELRSNNGLYALVMQGDGNLVLYEGVETTSRRAVWSTRTARLRPVQRPVRAVMQEDGNFVLRSAQGNPAWASGTQRNPGARLVLQDNRNLVIRGRNGASLWSSQTKAPGAPPETPPTIPPETPPTIPPETPPTTPPTPPPVASTEPLRVETPVQNIGWGKFMQTTATLYRDGRLVVSTHTRNDNWTGGLRGRVLIAFVDTAGQAIYVSRDFACTTRCSVPDFSCASQGTDLFSEQFPAVVGRYTQRLDIYQADTPSFADLRQRFIDAIKALEAIAKELKDAIMSVFG